MNKLNQLEIQNIRHICDGCTGFCDKIAYYKTLTEDENAIKVMQMICTECTNLKTNLSNML